MAISLVQQETFDGYGDLNSATPGNLGAAVTNTFAKRPGGPRKSGMSGSLGWSALTRNAANTLNADHTLTLATAQQTRGAFSAWFRPSFVGTDGSNKLKLITLRNSAGGTGNNEVSSVGFTGNGIDTVTLDHIVAYSLTSTSISLLPITLKVNQWIQLTCAWDGFNANAYVDWWLYVPGHATYGTPTQISGRRHNSFGTWTKVSGGVMTTGGGTTTNLMRGRYGLPSLWSIAALSDVNAINYDRSAETPNHGRLDFRLRPGDGSATDSGDGITQPWATWSRFTDALWRGELPGTPEQYWDATANAEYAMPWSTSPSVARQLEFAGRVRSGRVGCKPTDGCRVLFESDLQPIVAMGTAPNGYGYSLRGVNLTTTLGLQAQLGLTREVEATGTWSQPNAGTYPKVWQITVGASLTNCKVNQVDTDNVRRFLGVAMTTDQTTAFATLNTNPGRYWFNGTTLYVSTSDRFAPNITGRKFFYSTAASDMTNVCDFGQTYDVCWDGLYARDAGGQDKSGGSTGGYCFKLGGPGYVRNFKAERGCKHTLGVVESTVNNAVCVFASGTFVGGPAVHSFGSHTPNVIFRGGGKTGGGALFLGVVQLGGEEIAGTSNYEATTTGAEAMYGHIAGAAENYDLIAMVDCGEIKGSYSVGSMPAKKTIWSNTTAQSVGTRLNYSAHNPYFKALNPSLIPTGEGLIPL